MKDHIIGFIILWKGQPIEGPALDGTIAIGDSAKLFKTAAAAKRAIAAKIKSYAYYAETYPHQKWPNPSIREFRIIRVRNGE